MKSDFVFFQTAIVKGSVGPGYFSSGQERCSAVHRRGWRLCRCADPVASTCRESFCSLKNSRFRSLKNSPRNPGGQPVVGRQPVVETGIPTRLSVPFELHENTCTVFFESLRSPPKIKQRMKHDRLVSPPSLPCHLLSHCWVHWIQGSLVLWRISWFVRKRPLSVSYNVTSLIRKFSPPRTFIGP